MKKILTDNDIEFVRSVVRDYLNNPMPTLAGLAKDLGMAYNSLYKYLEADNEIGDLLMQCYYYYVQKHEEGLYGKSVNGHIFALHCLKKYITFKEFYRDLDLEDEINKPKDHKLIIEVVDAPKINPPTT